MGFDPVFAICMFLQSILSWRFGCNKSCKAVASGYCSITSQGNRSCKGPVKLDSDALVSTCVIKKRGHVGSYSPNCAAGELADIVDDMV